MRRCRLGGKQLRRVEFSALSAELVYVSVSVPSSLSHCAPEFYAHLE